MLRKFFTGYVILLTVSVPVVFFQSHSLLLKTGVLFLFAPIVPVMIFRFWNPPLSAFMLRAMRQNHKRILDHQWISYNRISPTLLLAAIVAEDICFLLHAGFDWGSIRYSVEFNRESELQRGGSTITQQLAKNLFLWPGRSYVRKAIEAYLTVLIEACWSKRRILEVYLNLAQFTPQIFGVEAAARHFFGRSASDLNPEEAALMTAILPSPSTHRADEPSPQLRFRQVMILASMKKINPEYLQSIESK
jgi:monofunctional glycosyltransferase